MPSVTSSVEDLFRGIFNLISGVLGSIFAVFEHAVEAVFSILTGAVRAVFKTLGASEQLAEDVVKTVWDNKVVITLLGVAFLVWGAARTGAQQGAQAGKRKKIA